MNIIINPRYNFLSPHIKRLQDPSYFDTHGTLLHTGRNVIKLFEAEGVRYVVKSFCQMTGFNRLIYGRLRPSKAFRAYSHAARIRRMGIDSPEQIAVVDIRRGLKLRHSYFVSLYSEYSSAATLTEEDFMHDAERIAGLDALSRFIYKMHRNGILHHDLNISNILYGKNISGQYVFQVIDANRMSFHSRLSVKERLKNLRRLSCTPMAFTYILERYASYAGYPSQEWFFKGFLARSLFEIHVWHKNRLKQSLKRIFS